MNYIKVGLGLIGFSIYLSGLYFLKKKQDRPVLDVYALSVAGTLLYCTAVNIILS